MSSEQAAVPELGTTNSQNQTVEPKKKKRRKRSIFSIFFDLLGIIIIVVLLAELVIGFINMQKLNNGEEPVWCLENKTEEKENKTIRTCNLGLYRIVKTDTDRETKITLKPFFLGEE